MTTEVTENVSPEMEKLRSRWHKIKRRHSPEELAAAVSNNKELITIQRSKRFIVRLLFRLALLIAIFYMVKQPIVYDQLMTHFRLTMKHVIRPIWRWDNLYEKECLISNPNHNQYGIGPEDCDRCRGVYSLLHVNLGNITEKSFTEFIDMDRPIIIRPDMTTLHPKWWSTAIKTGYFKNVKHLHDFYVHHPVFNAGVACHLTTNLNIRIRNQKFLLHHVMSTNSKDWFAHWEHCGRNQTRAFREVYTRPSYLPSSFDFTSPTWLYISQDFTVEEPIPLGGNGRATLIGQVVGEHKIALVPRLPCRDMEIGCANKPLFSVLQPGDMLSVPNAMWEIYIQPTNPGFNVAIGFSAV